MTALGLAEVKAECGEGTRMLVEGIVRTRLRTACSPPGAACPTAVDDALKAVGRQGLAGAGWESCDQPSVAPEASSDEVGPAPNSAQA